MDELDEEIKKHLKYLKRLKRFVIEMSIIGLVVGIGLILVGVLAILFIELPLISILGLITLIIIGIIFIIQSSRFLNKVSKL